MRTHPLHASAWALALLLPALGLAAAPVAVAEHATVLAGGTAEPGSWIRLHFHAAGDFELIWGADDPRKVGYGYALFDADGERWTTWVSGYDPRGIEATVAGPDGTRAEYVVQAAPDASRIGGAAGWYGFRGEMTLLAWVAGDVGNWTWTFEGAGVTLLAPIEEGAGAFVRTVEDFGGGTHADATAGWFGARATIGETSVTVERGLFAAAFSMSSNAVVRDGASESECVQAWAVAVVVGVGVVRGCVWDLEGAAEHRFHLAGGGAGWSFMNPVYFTGVDIVT